MYAVVDLVEDLIRCAPVSDEGVRKAVALYADAARQFGLQPRLIENQGLESLVAEVGGSGPTVVLNGHLDVVPGAPALFEPVRHNGRLYGRGAYDMLGAVASFLPVMAACRHLQRLRVRLMAVPDEETGGGRGTGHLVAAGWGGDFVIAGEPTNLDIGVQAKGILQVEVTVPGISAHGSRPWLGKNAIDGGYAAYHRIAALPFTRASTPLYAAPSLNLARIAGGDAINRVPDSCQLTLDIRYLPGQEPEQILAEIRGVAGIESLKVLAAEPPAVTPSDDPRVTALSAAVEAAACRRPRLFGQDGASDVRWFTQRGTLGVEFGPAGAGHHGPDEYLELDSLPVYIDCLVKYLWRLDQEWSPEGGVFPCNSSTTSPS